jgi:hypothetical protein
MSQLVNINDTIQKSYIGEVELIYKDKNGNILCVQSGSNIVKIFMKESISHRIAASIKWDPTVTDSTGKLGAWVSSGIDPLEEFTAKYIILGASYDSAGMPLDVRDSRYYEQDTVTGLYVPIRLSPGAAYGGGLINAIPINEECRRPLKRVEDFRFNATYQPAGTPLLQDDVRAINNILICETTLQLDEYNGFFGTSGDCFTITEVALVAGKRIDHVTGCDVDSHDLFMEGPYSAEIMAGTNIIKLTNCGNTGGSGIDFCNFIQPGDQIKVVLPGSSGGSSPVSMVSPYFLVLSKECFGQNLVVDRVPTASDGSEIGGTCEVYRDTMRILSHRILNSPAKKMNEVSITIRWSIIVS